MVFAEGVCMCPLRFYLFPIHETVAPMYNKIKQTKEHLSGKMALGNYGFENVNFSFPLSHDLYIETKASPKKFSIIDVWRLAQKDFHLVHLEMCFSLASLFLTKSLGKKQLMVKSANHFLDI